MKNHEYIEKWLSGTLSKQELEEFKQTPDYAEITRLESALLQFRAPKYDPESALEAFRAEHSGKAKVVQVSWFRTALRVAAVLAVAAIGYFLIFAQGEKTFSTGMAETTEVTLPDNSVVTLNASSEISFAKDNWHDRRSVKLNGEAFFKVAKGQQFLVETTGGTVTVLGTQFNVIARESYFEVICYEGRVAVGTKLGNQDLSPGQLIRVAMDEFYTEDNISATQPEWLSGQSGFISAPFEQVVREFERQYNVTINTSNVDTDKLYTGSFTHKNMTTALQSITIPFGMTYEIINDQQIILSGALD